MRYQVWHDEMEDGEFFTVDNKVSHVQACIDAYHNHDDGAGITLNDKRDYYIRACFDNGTHGAAVKVRVTVDLIGKPMTMTADDVRYNTPRT